MAFVSRYGNWYSENGWRMCDANELDRGAVPGTSLVLPIRKGVANLILKGWVAWFHRNVESLNNARGFSDEGAWTPTNDVANSNHLSGTAVDLNWSDHAFRVSYSGFTQAEINKVREGLKLFEGTIWWGQDWNSPKDPMHFQLNYGEGDARNAAFATKLQNGYLNIWSGGGGVIEPPAGVDDIYAELGDSGDRVKRLQQFFNDNFKSYSRLEVDGDFGPATKAVVVEFQKRVGVLADGIVGPVTLAAMVKHGFKTESGVKVANLPEDWTDRQVINDIWEQLRGPDGKGWERLGKNAKGENLSLVDAIAEVKKRLEAA
ncbi:lysin A [Mycobacterium phage Tourach]|uniref:Lysin A n=1 Tax=Mycobacterium phage Tourach TaxID=2599882 RepID=A0A5J6TTX6_9CAUD|nr:endolysin [Mycobacterium phage Tourach]QFG14265.1 lysin A [Mycobacterium phage Tourach]